MLIINGRPREETTALTADEKSPQKRRPPRRREEQYEMAVKEAPERAVKRRSKR